MQSLKKNVLNRHLVGNYPMQCWRRVRLDLVPFLALENNTENNFWNQYLTAIYLIYRSSLWRMFFKVVLKNFANFTGKHLCWSLFNKAFIKFIKKTPTQVFSCEICKIFKKNFFYRKPLVADSVCNVRISWLYSN